MMGRWERYQNDRLKSQGQEEQMTSQESAVSGASEGHHSDRISGACFHLLSQTYPQSPFFRKCEQVFHTKGFYLGTLRKSFNLQTQGKHRLAGRFLFIL